MRQVVKWTYWRARHVDYFNMAGLLEKEPFPKAVELLWLRPVHGHIKEVIYYANIGIVQIIRSRVVDGTYPY